MKNLHSQIDIFYNTKNWKNYWTKGLSNFIKEIKFWDNIIVPLSKISDLLLCNLFGKSIVCVYKKIN